MMARTPISLDALAGGARAVVDRIVGGPELTARLAAMGLAVGSRVTVLQNTGHGPLLIFVRETRIALGREEAARVLVREVTE